MIIKSQLENKYFQKLSHQARLKESKKEKQVDFQRKANEVLCELLIELGYEDIVSAYKRI